MTDIKLPPLPEPDTHCWDDDAVPPRDVWSHSAEQLHAYSLAVAQAVIKACCRVVYGQCESDNAAQRTVDAIRAMKIDGETTQ